jgi:hypothetical protein
MSVGGSKMIINIKHCFVPIELPDMPSGADIMDSMKRYNDFFDYYSIGGTDAIRCRYDTLGIVQDEIVEAIHG